MKQQLSRILNNDFKKVDMLLDNKLDTINHISQTLTQRTKFLQCFQDMIKRQISQIYYQDSLELPSSSRAQMYLQPNQPLIQLANQDDQYISSPLLTLHQMQSSQYTQSISNINTNKMQKEVQTNYSANHIPKLLQEIRQLKHQLVALKTMLEQQIEKYVAMVCNDYIEIAGRVFNALTNIYEIKIKEVSESNDRLNVQILELEEQLSRYTQQSTQLVPQQPTKLNQLTPNASKRIMSQLGKSQKVNRYASNMDQVVVSQPKVSEVEALFNAHQFETISNRYSSSIQLKYGQKHNCISLGPHKNQLNNIYIYRDNNNQLSHRHSLMDKLVFNKHPKQNNNSSSKENNYQNKKLIKNDQQPQIPSIIQRGQTCINYDIPELKIIEFQGINVKDGYNVYKINGKNIYRGMWKDGKFFGRGQLVVEDFTYDGDFKEGCFHGNGSLLLHKNNIHFMGQFRQHKVDGEGTFKVANSQPIIGEWKQNKFVRKF